MTQLSKIAQQDDKCRVSVRVTTNKKFVIVTVSTMCAPKLLQYTPSLYNPNMVIRNTKKTSSGELAIEWKFKYTEDFSKLQDYVSYTKEVLMNVMARTLLKKSYCDLIDGLYDQFENILKDADKDVIKKE